ncbi:hypothetical protein HMPREF1860_00441 [Prevotella amnii]|uniref:Uncharacterized protein n=1 Tax=Prevotella amnii TaxID=419005 RepID=A0A134BJM9_9BACT|nr:hypothetical protein [Prevotella amnii]KXB80153.1 hypothetical protein HMPREF1860_00441 [Prevotella amnii]
MKHFFLSYKVITAALTMGLAAITTSCSQDIDNSNASLKGNKAESAKIVKLSFGPHTRGTMYDDISQMADNATFGVYGYARKNNESIITSPNFINNGSAEKKDGIVRVNGEVATYKESMPKVKIAAVYPKLDKDNAFTRTGENTYTLTYALKEDMSTQQDLLIGEAPEFTITDANSKNDVIDGKQTVDMHHALTAINFAIGDRLPTGYTIEGICLKNLYTKGTCKVDLSNTNTTDADRFKWEDLSEKKDVYIKTNHITTTQVNRTQFTGLKTGNKYDNLTIFMIPQPVGKDAEAEVILKKDTKEYVSVRDEKGQKVTPENDTRVKIKRITIPLERKEKEKEKDGKSYIAGEVVKYLVNNVKDNTKKGDSNINIELVKPGNYEYTSKTIQPNSESFCKKDGEKQNTYNVFINCYRYAVNTDKTKKHFNHAIIASNTFTIKSIEYKTYNEKTKKSDYTQLSGENVNCVTWKITKQPKGDDTIGSFSLTFDPSKYPIVEDKPKKGVKQEHKFGTKDMDKFKITLVADGFEGKYEKLEIICKDYPK